MKFLNLVGFLTKDRKSVELVVLWFETWVFFALVNDLLE